MEATPAQIFLSGSLTRYAASLGHDFDLYFGSSNA
jgi:hypothetical protein